MTWLIIQYEDKPPTLCSSRALIGMENGPKTLERLKDGLTHLEALRYLDKWKAIYEVDRS